VPGTCCAATHPGPAAHSRPRRPLSQPRRRPPRCSSPAAAAPPRIPAPLPCPSPAAPCPSPAAAPHPSTAPHHPSLAAAPHPSPSTPNPAPPALCSHSRRIEEKRYLLATTGRALRCLLWAGCGSSSDPFSRATTTSVAGRCLLPRLVPSWIGRGCLHGRLHEPLGAYFWLTIVYMAMHVRFHEPLEML
jgi:hypothetical protein